MPDPTPYFDAPPAEVSVIIPAFNAEAYLPEAVASAVHQSLGPFEIIVVDDGSTDGTATVAETLGPAVRLLQQANGGPAGAMNTGVDAATGNHLAFLSADDRWALDKLEVQTEELRRRPEIDMAFGHVSHFLSPDLEPEVAAVLHCPDQPMSANSAGTMLIRADTFRRVGRFDPQYRTGEFFDWFGRAIDLGLKAEVLPQVVSYRRVHQANHSRVERAPETGYAQVLKAMMDRRRQAALQQPPAGETQA